MRAVAATVLVAALFGCRSAAPPAETASPTPSADEKYRVVISEYKFNPKTLVVPVGTTVTWVNLDVVPHTISSTGTDSRIDSRRVSHRGTFAHTFTTAGRFQYLCMPHPGMQGVIVVQ